MTRAQPWPRHRCAHPTCAVMIPLLSLACTAHWSELPGEVRSRLWAAYRAQDVLLRNQALADCTAYFRGAAREVVTA